MKGAMTKSLFLATGIFCCLLGLELLLIDSAVVRPFSGEGESSTFTAPEWAPWTLLSVGAVTILHFCTVPGSAASASFED